MDGHDMAQPLRARLTYHDFLGFPEDGQRHELIDGEHYVSPSPFTRHQRISKRLFLALNRHLESAGTGEVFYAPFDVVLSFFDVVEPDLLVILNQQAKILTEKHVHGAPAVVVEILSGSTRRLDEDVKRRLYGRAGVLEYWLVDPDASTITVCSGNHARVTSRRTSGGMAAAPAFESGVLPGFSVRLDELFR